MADEKRTEAVEAEEEEQEEAAAAAETRAADADAPEVRHPRPGAETRLLLKKLEDQLAALKEENAGFKRRADEERKAKLTEEQRIAEERDEYKQQFEELQKKLLEKEVRMKYGIDETFVLVGSDQEALEAHAREIKSKLPRPRAGTASQPGHESGGPVAFKRSQLRDPNFFKANEAAIMQAQREGRITQD